MYTVQRSIVTLLALATSGMVFAQGGLPASQPNYLTIIREEVKLGRSAEHTKLEAGWPAVFEKVKWPDYYVAAESLTGRSEVWFIVPSASHQAMGESLKRESTDPVLSVELPRLSRADSDVLASVSSIQTMARKDLSFGAFPDVGKMRFYEITLFRVRPGHEEQFEAAAKAYGSAAQRSAPGISYRVYEVMAGMPGPTYFVFSSVASYGDFDEMMTSSMAIMKGASEEERRTLQTFSAEGLVNTETQRFRVDPAMSYVPKETRASDPDFWMPKKLAPAKSTSASQQ